jgi:hypothetical protein
MRAVIIALFVVVTACGEAPEYETCGLVIFDTLVTKEIACASVRGVQEAYDNKGIDVDVRSTVDGVGVSFADLGSDTAGQYNIYDQNIELSYSIVDNPAVAEYQIVFTLVHEIIHAVQDREEGLDIEEMMLHPWPYYVYSEDGAIPSFIQYVDGEPSIWQDGNLAALRMLRTK